MAGYRELMLWTNDTLVSACRICEAAGFALIKEERHHSFRHDLIGQYWGMVLQQRLPATLTNSQNLGALGLLDLGKV
ncbi:MAG: hypothetical protein ACREVI_03990 [Steroidobacteraceae bacterium]